MDLTSSESEEIPLTSLNFFNHSLHVLFRRNQESFLKVKPSDQLSLNWTRRGHHNPNIPV